MTSQQKRKRKVLLEGWRRFFVSSFVVRQLLAKSKKMGPKSITNGTNLAQGGGKGYPKINLNMKK
jgi:hypothetical protein